MRQGHTHLSDTRVLRQHIARLAGGPQGHDFLSFKVRVKIYDIHRKGLELPQLRAEKEIVFIHQRSIQCFGDYRMPSAEKDR